MFFIISLLEKTPAGNIRLFLKKYFLRKSVYIVFTLMGIILYYLNFFIINVKFSLGAVENKARWELDDTAQFIISIIEPAGVWFNFLWFVITGIIIMVKSINYFNDNYNDRLLLKVLGIIFGILGGLILILSSVIIVPFLYMMIYGA